MSTCHVPIKDKEKLSTTCISEEGLFLKNIFCKCQTSGGILLQSLGGDLFDGSVSHLFRTCFNLEVWGKYHLKLINEHRKQNALLNNNQDTPGRKTDYKSKCGLQPEETNLLSLLLQQVADNLVMQSETEQNNEHIVDNESNLYKVLTAANFNLLNEIKTDLAEHNPGKWTQRKLDRLYPEILRSAQVLNRECTAKELCIISKVLQVFTGRKFYSPSMGKGCNVNMISKAFEGDNFISEVKCKFKCAVKNPISLTTQCRNLLMQSFYADTAMKVSYAEVCHIVNKTIWGFKVQNRFECKNPLQGFTTYVTSYNGFVLFSRI